MPPPTPLTRRPLSMTYPSRYPFASVRSPRIPLRLNVSPGLSSVPSMVLDAATRLAVREGLYGEP